MTGSIPKERRCSMIADEQGAQQVWRRTFFSSNGTCRLSDDFFISNQKNTSQAAYNG